MLQLGKIVLTKAITETVPTPLINGLLKRHFIGDDGELCNDDKLANVCAREHNERILSCYFHEGKTIYIITEANRSYTTILYADEY